MQNSKLTLYIFIALILGVVAGYLYNVYVIGSVNKRIDRAEVSIKNIDNSLRGYSDTTGIDYKMLEHQRIIQGGLREANDSLRDDKLEGFNILNDIFLRLIKMIIGPLVFSTLVVGVAKVGDVKAVGRIGGKTMLLFIGATFVSLLLGMLMVNFFAPGKAIQLTIPDTHLSAAVNKTALSLKEFIGHVFPRSFFEAMTNNEILQIVVFSLFFGIGTAAIGEKGEIVIKAMDAIAHVMLKITGYIMAFAPVAVFGAITAVVAKQGIGILSAYAVFLGEFIFHSSSFGRLLF